MLVHYHHVKMIDSSLIEVLSIRNHFSMHFLLNQGLGNIAREHRMKT